MAQTSSGMGSLFAGIMEGWNGVGKIFDDVEVQRKTQKIKELGEKNIADERAKTNATSTKLSTALLDSPDTSGPTQTTQTGTTPYTGPKVAGDNKPADPYLITNKLPIPTLTHPNAPAPSVQSMTDQPSPVKVSANPFETPGVREGGNPSAPAASATPAPVVPAAAAPAIPAAPATPFAANPQQALPTYADAAMGQNLLGITSPGASRRSRPGGLDFTPEQQQAIATAPPVATARAPIRTAQRPASTLLPQVDLFGNPILPPTVSNV